jgi:hypothetical protein
MNRLPGYDARTRSAELAVFSSLGLVALALIGFAVLDAMKFVVNRDAIIAAVSGQSQRALSKEAAAKTNVAVATPAVEIRWQGEQPPGTGGTATQRM